jgi:hypothetical protein
MKIEKINYNFFWQKLDIKLLFSTEKEFCLFVKNKYWEVMDEDWCYGLRYRPEYKNIKNNNVCHNYLFINTDSFNVKSLDWLNTIIHETEHFVNSELSRKWIRMTYTDESPEDEVFAYLMGDVCSRIINKIYNLKLK